MYVGECVCVRVKGWVTKDTKDKKRKMGPKYKGGMWSVLSFLSLGLWNGLICKRRWEVTRPFLISKMKAEKDRRQVESRRGALWWQQSGAAMAVMGVLVVVMLSRGRHSTLQLQSAPRKSADHMMPGESSSPWMGPLFAVAEPLSKKKKKKRRERERKGDHLVLQWQGKEITSLCT